MTHALAEPVGTFNVVREAAVLSNLAPGADTCALPPASRQSRTTALYPAASAVDRHAPQAWRWECWVGTAR
jgi:hypothetical protein